jgi:hypothetical protein
MPQFVCPLCAQPLSAGSAVLFQGDVLVHAGCWSPLRKLLGKAGKASDVTDPSVANRSSQSDCLTVTSSPDGGPR